MTLNLDTIQARADAATTGPWEVNDEGDDWACISSGSDSVVHTYMEGDDCGECSQESRVSISIEDAEFIAHAREDIPALIARIRELEAAIDAIGTVIDDPEGWGWSDQDGMLESICSTIEDTGRKVISE